MNNDDIGNKTIKAGDDNYEPQKTLRVTDDEMPGNKTIKAPAQPAPAQNEQAPSAQDLEQLLKEGFSNMKGLWSGFAKPDEPRVRKLGIKVSPGSATNGGKIKFTYQRNEVCTRCNGTGVEAGTGVGKVTCTTCAGKGQVEEEQASTFGPIKKRTTCPACKGRGVIIFNPCPMCSSSGVCEQPCTLMIDLPPLKEPRTEFTLKEWGDYNLARGKYDDLQLVVFIKEKQ